MAAKYHRRQIFKEEQQHFSYYNYYLLKERPKCQQANLNSPCHSRSFIGNKLQLTFNFKENPMLLI